MDSEGGIQYLAYEAYDDTGSAFNDPLMIFFNDVFSNVYKPDSWGIKLNEVKTDKPCNIWVRAPGKLVQN